MRIYDVKTKLVKTTFTVVSIILLFANWIVTYGDFEYNWMKYRSDIMEELNMIKGFSAFLPDEIDIDGIESVIDCILDGKLSPVEMTTIAVEADSFFEYVELEGGSDTSDLATARMYLWGYLMAFGSLIIIACVMLYNIWKNNKAIFEYGFLVMQFCLCMAACCLCLATSKITSQLDLEQMCIIKPTIWMVLAVICAAPINWLEKLPLYNSDFIKSEFLRKSVTKGKDIAISCGGKIQNVVVEKWECKCCGTKNNIDSKYCSNCGCKKSEKVECTNCGFEIQDDDFFCKNCGIRIEKDKIICSSCGCSIDTVSKFCEYCGEKVK